MAKSLCGVQVSDIGLGTWGMGGKQSPSKGEDEKHIQAIRYGLDNGINLIDTAEMYASGHTEEVVGKAIEPYNRDDIFIISKVWHTNLRRRDVLNSARKSVERLNSDYIDLYLIHWPNPSIPVSETIAAMEELISEGLVRNIGVSNFSVEQTRGAMASAKISTVCANQIEYNYGNRAPERDIIPFCEENGVSVIAYTPVMKGRTAGFKRLEEMAEKYGATTVQMALRYTMERSIPIPKSSNPAHIRELIDASKIELSKDDYRLLTE